MSLPLDIWRHHMGLPPWYFWGFGQSVGPAAVVPLVKDGNCSKPVYEYDWQGNDAAGRSTIRQAIREAEQLLAGYLQYRPAPAYTERTVDWPRHYEASLTRLRSRDATGRPVAVFAPEGYIQQLGVEQLMPIDTATVANNKLVYSALFNANLEDTFTITVTTTVTDPSEVAVYFAAADRFDGMDFSSAVGERWRIEPVQVSISGGNAVITGRKWLVGKPILYENPVQAPLDPTTAANFVTSLEVYQRTTDTNGNSTTTSQATLIYESSDCAGCWGPCWCTGAPSSTDPAATGLVIARAGIRDSVLGIVTPGAAAYDTASSTWSTSWCCGGFCDPDRVTLRYLAGYPLENGQMAPQFRPIVAKLATAQLKRRIVACREYNEIIHDLQQDLTLESTETERYAYPPEWLTNPFGTRRGHVQAWLAARNHILRRGIAA